MVQVHAVETSWKFESSPGHQIQNKTELRLGFVVSGSAKTRTYWLVADK
jgi:hypothetical protein